MTTANYLLVFHSSEGQTAKVADRVAAVLRDGGVDVDVHEVGDAPTPDGYDAVVLGDSIHAGRHSRALTRYAAIHAEALNAKPLALFQVSLTSATDDAEHATEAHRLLHKLIDGTGIDPDLVGLFAGSLAYTRYGWLKRRMMRRIAADQGEQDIDTSQDHEYTDWDAVDHFARDAVVLAVTDK
jgi:menaquinone-dependent protoporphyrinogen oxidase